MLHDFKFSLLFKQKYYVLEITFLFQKTMATLLKQWYTTMQRMSSDYASTPVLFRPEESRFCAFSVSFSEDSKEIIAG